ncbi:MAG: hypothetical protein WBO93_16950 [Gammaproteobacteria bacterium]
MSNLIIKDLTNNYDLDKAATSVILGGVNEWIRNFTLARPTNSPMSVFNINYTNNTYIDNDFIMVQPTIFNIGNGVNNSGSISYDVNSVGLSPVNIQA